MPVIPIATGVWPKTSVKDVAESLGLSNLSDDAAAALAADVEFRLTQLIEDSIKFMRHSKRTNLLVEDVDYALRAKNIEPLWGFASTDTLSFRRTTSAVGNLYFIDEEEIDLTKVLAAELPPIPQETSYSAHWLAIEGVQPAIPQNPTPAELESHPAFTEFHPPKALLNSKQTPESRNITTKEHLSHELRLYFDRVTAAALSDDQCAKNAALASLSGDPGLHQLVPYLIQFVAENITKILSQATPSLVQLRDTMRILESVLSNQHSYLEPYLHQILPSILTCLLSSSFAPSSDTDEIERDIRYTAGSLLKSQLNRYQHSYSTLRTRVLKTLTKSLIDPQSTDRNRLGAIIGVKCLGVEPTRIVLAQNVKAFGECLDASLNEGKTDQNRIDNIVKEALKIMSELYSEKQTIRSANHKQKRKKLKRIPAQDELEAEVGVQFAARLMSTSDQEETKLAYMFIRESTGQSNADDSEQDEDMRSENGEGETSKMDIFEEDNDPRPEAEVTKEKQVQISDPVNEDQPMDVEIENPEEPVAEKIIDKPDDSQPEGHDNPLESKATQESNKKDDERHSEKDGEGEDMVLGSDNQGSE